MPSILTKHSISLSFLINSETRGFGQVATTAVIELISVTGRDSGLYICKGSNPAGDTEKRVELRVNYYPIRGDITGNINHLIFY